ncbi:MAG TPA: J domain-containing protein [Aliidongia sp.]|nr:J domain-containing protein [Aliidongia sp.]
MNDPYATLGIQKEATAAQIQSAYRRLAKKHHPDLNPGKPEAEEQFKAVGAAYALLSDPEKRARFDRGEIDASGAERPPGRPFYRDFADHAEASKYGAEAAYGGEDLDDLLKQFFGRRGGRGRMASGADLHYSLTVDFLEAANGAVKRLALPDGKTLDVTIPAGFESGKSLRLRGQGEPGAGSAPAGDALIEVSVAPHAFFRRDGKNVIVELPVTLQEAVLGAKVRVPTIKGPVNLQIPAHSSTGTRLRLKERGIAGGHQYVELRVAVPPEEEPELEAFLRGWAPAHPFDPRKGMPT